MPPAPTKATLTEEDDSSASKCVIVEAAKSGRSKCRACMEAISEGEMRVGMESWMVGRQVVVWQHPRCFLACMTICEASGGRSKCKQSKQPLEVGEKTVRLVAHTTTAHIKLRPAGMLLAPVLRAVSDSAALEGKGRGAVSLDALRAVVTEGCLDELSSSESKSLADGLAEGGAVPASSNDDGKAGLGVSVTPSQAEVMEAKHERKQPAKESIEKATGKVAWKWAGTLCYGSLLPAKETKTHCYARTQRGNVKTLTKGGEYWWQM